MYLVELMKRIFLATVALTMLGLSTSLASAASDNRKLDAPLDIYTQLLNLEENASFPDFAQGNWLATQVSEITSGPSSAYGQRLLDLSYQIFQMKTQGTVPWGRSSAEALLDFARLTTAPDLVQNVGFSGQMKAVCSPIFAPLVVPGISFFRAGVDTNLSISPAMWTDSKNIKHQIFVSLEVIDRASTNTIFTKTFFVDLPSSLPAQGFEPPTVEVTWDGLEDGGNKVDNEKIYYLHAAISLVEQDIQKGNLRIIDQMESVFYPHVVSSDRLAQPSVAIEDLEWAHAASVGCKLGHLDKESQEAVLANAQAIGSPADKLIVQTTHAGTLRYLGGPLVSIPVNLGMGETDTPENRAFEFIRQYRNIIGLKEPDLELILNSTKAIDAATVAEFYQTNTQGLPVFDHGVSVVINQNGEISGYYSRLWPTEAFDLANVVTKDEVTSIVENELLPFKTIQDPITTLGLLAPDVLEEQPVSDARVTLAWKVRIEIENGGSWDYFIDAITGSIIGKIDLLLRDSPYEVYESYGSYPGLLIIKSNPYYWYGSFPGSSFNVYAGTYYTSQYYANRYNRNSWDNGKGDPQYHRYQAVSDGDALPPDNPQGPNNGYWDWNHAAAVMGSHMACTDAVGHEFTHGIFRLEVGDSSDVQHGSLAESYGDVMGDFVEGYSNGSHDWLVGTGGTCTPFRSLSDPEYTPGVTPGPAHWSNFNRFGSPGDIHRNSGITSKASWLMGRESAEGQTTFAGIPVTGIGSNDAGAIWYDTLVNGTLAYWSGFRDFRYKMIIRAFYYLFVNDPTKATAVRNALDAVGIWTYSTGTSAQSNDPVALANFTVGSQWRKHLFYSTPDQNNPSWGRLYQVYRTCALDGSCSWSTPYQVSWSFKGPSAVVFNGYLWLFYKYDLTNSIMCIRMDTSGNWGNCPNFPSDITSDRGPSAVAYSAYNNIYLFYKPVGSGLQTIKYRVGGGGTSWTSERSLIGTGTTEGPIAMGPVYRQDTGFFAYIVHSVPNGTDPNKTDILYTQFKFLNESTIDYNPGITDIINGGFAAEYFRTRIHISYRTTSNQIKYASVCRVGDGCTYRPGETTAIVPQDDSGYGFLKLFGDIDAKLYLFFGAWQQTPASPVYYLSKGSE